MSAFGKEIITIQFGSMPNYVGAHFFNIQNSGFSFNPEFPTDINHDILFREGKTDAGAFAYTPRLISVDFEQALGSLSKTGQNFVRAPLAAEVQEVTNTEKVEVCQFEAPPDKNEYYEDLEKQAKSQEKHDAMDVDLILKTKYDLTNSIQSWSEVLTMNLHPRTITTIPKTLSAGLDVSKSTSKVGDEIWKNPAFADDFEDNLRFQLEACDTVQGFHLLTECDNLFSGMSNGCLDYLRDECGKKSILMVPIFKLYADEESTLDNRKRLCANLINSAFSFTKSNELSDLIAPLSTLSELWTVDCGSRNVDHVKYDGSSNYHSSAILAACLELVSTPYRLKRLPETKMSNVANLLTLPARKFVGAGVVFPFPDRRVDYDILELLKRHKYSSLCPFVPLESTLDVQAVTLRGFPSSQFPTSPALFVSPNTLRIPRTFPDILPDEHDLSNSSMYYGRLREVNALSGLCNTREMRVLVDNLSEKVKSLNVHKMPNFISTDLEKPEFDEIVNDLQEISSSYDISMFL